MIVLSGFPGQFLNSFGLSVVCEQLSPDSDISAGEMVFGVRANERQLKFGITFAVRLAKQDASYKGVLVGVCRVEVHAHRVTEQLSCDSRMNFSLPCSVEAFCCGEAETKASKICSRAPRRARY